MTENLLGYRLQRTLVIVGTSPSLTREEITLTVSLYCSGQEQRLEDDNLRLEQICSTTLNGYVQQGYRLTGLSEISKLPNH